MKRVPRVLGLARRYDGKLREILCGQWTFRLLILIIRYYRIIDSAFDFTELTFPLSMAIVNYQPITFRSIRSLKRKKLCNIILIVG